MLGLQVGLPEGRSKSLIDFVIRQMLRLLSEFILFGGYHEGGQRLGSLPWPEINKRFVIAGRDAFLYLPLEEWKMRH